MIDYYEHGQHCDETGSGRRSQAHLLCCDKQALAKLDSANPVDRNALARVLSIAESELCVYELTVCVQMLCEKSEVSVEDKGVSKYEPPTLRLGKFLRGNLRVFLLYYFLL